MVGGVYIRSCINAKYPGGLLAYDLRLCQVWDVDTNSVTVRKFGDDHDEACDQVQHEQGEIVVGVMCGDQEQGDRNAQQELLDGGKLVTVVDLLPHGEIVEGAVVKVEWRALHLVEHYIRANHVTDVGKGPAHFVGEERNEVEEHLEQHYNDYVDHPCSLEVDPVGVHVVLEVLVLFLVEPFRLDFRDDRGGPSATVFLCVRRGRRQIQPLG